MTIFKRNNISIMTLFFILFMAFASCNKEELFVDNITEVVDETPEEEETEDTEEGEEKEDEEETEEAQDEEEVIVNPDLPCEFTLDNVEANSTVIINCILDLGEKTVNLPNNVELVYEGGDIINGTLNFSANSIIDGRFLNSTLNITGVNPTAKSPIFDLLPHRWELVEGKTTSDIALKNRDILEGLFEQVKLYEIHTVKLDKLDAYFEVGKVTSTTSNQNFYASQEAINVPSDFNLIMTNNTHLRVFPNNAPKYCLLALRDVTNVTVTGGNLYGDRDEHDYSSGGSHEWGDVVELHAAKNSTIDNVTMKNGSGDGLRIHSLKHAFEADYNPSNNLTVKNCTMDSNRRNNISIVDGFNIYIDRNQILNAGVDTPNSTGTNPRFGLDVEAVRKSDGNGGYIYYQKAQDIYITNNTEKGSARGGMTIHIGYNVTIDGNYSESGLSYTYAHGSKIINNTVTAVPGRTEGAGIGGGKNSESTSIYNNIIAGNTITGFDTGINISNRDVKVYNNVIKDFEVGIYPINLIDSEIYNNTMSSTQDKSKGIFVFRSDMDNVIIKNNDITAEANSIKLDECNNSGDAVNYVFNITGNSFKSPSYAKIDGVQGVKFSGNYFNQGVQVYNSKNLNFTDNSITTGATHDGIRFRETNNDITLKDNKIDVTEGRDCIVIDSSTSTSEINSSNNECL